MTWADTRSFVAHYCFVFSKTLVYEKALSQNRIDDVLADITRSLDVCTLKFSSLIDDTVRIDMNDMKSLEMMTTKYRILSNDVELISYDIEQYKYNNVHNQRTIVNIERQWRDLLVQVKDKYQLLTNNFEHIKCQQMSIDQLTQQLDAIEKQVKRSTMQTKFGNIAEQLRLIERRIKNDFNDETNRHVQLVKRNVIVFDCSLNVFDRLFV
jgi:hypothetical protein